MTHDYKRHGTTTLFAALDVATGEVIHQCLPRHRHQEFLRFIRSVERRVDPDLELHFILDNYATHKHPKVKAWLDRNPRVHFHFLPTSTSWLNLIEHFFSDFGGCQSPDGDRGHGVLLLVVVVLLLRIAPHVKIASCRFGYPESEYQDKWQGEHDPETPISQDRSCGAGEKHP